MDNFKSKEQELNSDIFSLRNAVKEQMAEMYMEGAKAGAISTVSTLYSVLETLGLPESNILYDFLRDIAKKNGCDDLKAHMEMVKSKKDNL